jgi:hypothetical protein
MDLYDALKADITLSEIDRCHRTIYLYTDSRRDVYTVTINKPQSL